MLSSMFGWRGLASIDRIALVLLAACRTTAPVPATPVQRVPTAPAGERRVFHQLRVGKAVMASRTTFELTLDGSRAQLSEVDERADHGLELADVERGARWTVAARQTYHGTASGPAGAPQLALEAAGVQSLQLHCVVRSLDVAAAGAHRVPSSEAKSGGECDGGVWEPRTTTRVDALVCDAGVPDPDGDDDDQLVFAARAVEYVAVNDGCALRGGGLRLMSSDEH